MVYALMLRRTPILALLSMLAACSTPDPPAAARRAPWLTRMVSDTRLGLGFELPADWIEVGAGEAVVYSGPKGEEAYATTISVQPVAAQGRTLDEVIEASVADVRSRRRFQWLFSEPVVLCTHAALRYAFELEMHEQLQLRHGLLVAAPGRFIDLAYSAPPELFARGLPAFEHAIETIEIGVSDDTRSRALEPL